MFASLSKVAATAVLVTTISLSAHASNWVVDAENSRLGFEVQQGPDVTSGEFTSWSAQIVFDPAAPEKAEISAQIQTGTATTGNANTDQVLPTSDWFDTGNHPDAAFTSESVSLVEGNTYRAEGILAIRGISHPVALDFTLTIDGDEATATGSAEILRLDYKLGATIAEDTVANAVRVVLDLKASR